MGHYFGSNTRLVMLCGTVDMMMEIIFCFFFVFFASCAGSARVKIAVKCVSDSSMDSVAWRSRSHGE